MARTLCTILSVLFMQGCGWRDLLPERSQTYCRLNQGEAVAQAKAWTCENRAGWKPALRDSAAWTAVDDHW